MGKGLQYTCPVPGLVTASHVLEPGRAVNGRPMSPNPAISMSTASRYKAGSECWGEVTFLHSTWFFSRKTSSETRTNKLVGRPLGS